MDEGLFGAPAMNEGTAQSSPLLANLLGGGGGGGQLDPETLRTLAAIRAMLQRQGAGQAPGVGQVPTTIDPLKQAAALSQIQQTQQPVMGPQSNGVRFLFPGGSPVPPNPQMNQAMRMGGNQALTVNILDALSRSGLLQQGGQGLARLFGGGQR
jgi:hypothetical protein